MKNLNRIKKLMKKYHLTVGDLPAFPPKDIDLERLVVTIGKAKNKKSTNKS